MINKGSTAFILMSSHIAWKLSLSIAMVNSASYLMIHQESSRTFDFSCMFLNNRRHFRVSLFANI